MSTLTSTHIPYVPITVQIPELNLETSFSALLDTGFNAEIVIPRSAVRTGTLALLQADVRLADGSRITLPLYLGNVRVGDTAIGPVSVMVMGDEAVIGLDIITQFELTIDHNRLLTMKS
jgi:predicted aspartyl protease